MLGFFACLDEKTKPWLLIYCMTVKKKSHLHFNHSSITCLLFIIPLFKVIYYSKEKC